MFRIIIALITTNANDRIEIIVICLIILSIQKVRYGKLQAQESVIW